MRITYTEMLNRLAEKSIDNTRQLRRAVKQRRNGMEDLYGVESTHQGDADSPATFYVSVSPDLTYYERFSFKFVIQPYVSSVGGIDAGTITLGDTLITPSFDATDTGNEVKLTPNPHTHSVNGSIGGLSYGVKKISTDSTNWRVVIHGIDITPYLIEQHDGEWIQGEGIYPNGDLVGKKAFYDILDVAGMMRLEGRIAEADLLLEPEFKRVQIFSDKPFAVTKFLYLKYGHVNR